MQDITKCIYERINKLLSNWNSTQYLHHGSTKLQLVLEVLCTLTPLVMETVDTFFWGVLGSESCRAQLLQGECSGFDGFQEQKTEVPV